MRTLDSTLRFSGTSQVLSVGAASAAVTNGVSANIHDVRVVSTTNCWVTFGTAPTASAAAGSIYLPAGVVEYFHVSPGQKLAAIQDSGSGTLSLAEMTR